MEGDGDPVERLLQSSLVAKLQTKLSEKTAALSTAAEVGKLILQKNQTLERGYRRVQEQLQEEQRQKSLILPELKELRRKVARYSGLTETNPEAAEASHDAAAEAQIVELQETVSKLQAELVRVREQQGELTEVGSNLEHEVVTLREQLRASQSTVSSRELQIAKLQEHVASQEADSQVRLERVSAMLFEVSGESAAAKADRDCAEEELEIQRAVIRDLELQVEQLSRHLEQLEADSATPRGPGTPVQRMSLLSEIEGHMIERISSQVFRLLHPPDDTQPAPEQLTVEQLAKVVKDAIQESRELERRAFNSSVKSPSQEPRARGPFDSPPGRRRSVGESSPGHPRADGLRASVDSLRASDSPRSSCHSHREESRDDDALHEFFCMCCIAINLARIDSGRMAVPRAVNEELYRDAKQAEVPLHKWYEWATVEMERRALRLEDLMQQAGDDDSVGLSAQELDSALAGANNSSYAAEFSRFHDCHTQ